LTAISPCGFNQRPRSHGFFQSFSNRCQEKRLSNFLLGSFLFIVMPRKET